MLSSIQTTNTIGKGLPAQLGLKKIIADVLLYINIIIIIYNSDRIYHLVYVLK